MQIRQSSSVKFVLKASMMHTLTYIVCGMVFSQVFNYEELFKLGNAAYFMRDAYGTSSLIGPLSLIFSGLSLPIIAVYLKRVK